MLQDPFRVSAIPVSALCQVFSWEETGDLRFGEPTGNGKPVH